MGESAATDYIQSYFSECSFAYAEVDSKELKITFVNADGMKKFSATLDHPFEHGVFDEIVDTVNDNVFDGEHRSAVEKAMQFIAPAILFSMLFGFFVTFRQFFGCVGGKIIPKSRFHSKERHIGLQMDASTRSTAGLMDHSTSSAASGASHFLDDRSSGSGDRRGMP